MRLNDADDVEEILMKQPQIGFPLMKEMKFEDFDDDEDSKNVFFQFISDEEFDVDKKIEKMFVFELEKVMFNEAKKKH